MAYKNLLDMFFSTVKRQGDKTCFRFKSEGKWQTYTWNQTEVHIRDIALGLRRWGAKPGEMLAIFSSTRLEWVLCDLAILSLGGVTIPIYQSNTPDQAAYILQNSESRLVFVEDKKQLNKILSELSGLPLLEKIVLMSGEKVDHPKVMTLAELQALGRSEDAVAWRDFALKIDPKQMATLVYTSGTTGPPKGAILTHGNFLAELEACQDVFKISDSESSIIFLPLAHILARVMQFFHFYVGFEESFAESIDKLVDNLSDVRPHFFVAVPRIFEKVYERVLSQAAAGNPFKKAVFKWATGVGKTISVRKQQGLPVGPLLSLLGGIAHALVFKKLTQRLGGSLRYAVSGGAPLAKEIGEFFHAAGILILEGYGLSETTGAVNCNQLDRYRFGTVGPAIKGVEEKIAEDGEICVRGPVVFQGYYKDNEATKKVLDDDGWFKTGDIGVIEGGFLKITDRKKDIIVTAGGKNIAPQNIENLLKTIPMVSQVMVHGDRRKFLTALVTLNREPVEDNAKKEGISFSNFDELSHHPRVYEWIKQSIDEKNKIMASYESIKKFAILSNDFSQETGELTPTLKVKRKFVTEKYKEVIEGLYQE